MHPPGKRNCGTARADSAHGHRHPEEDGGTGPGSFAQQLIRFTDDYTGGLAGLAPAARELAKSRLFAERALFLSHRMPLLFRWQSELLILETSQLPIMQELRTNTLRTASALERASKVIQAFPSLIRSEREQVLKALPSQEPTLTNVAAHVAATLAAGQEMANSLNTTLQSFGDPVPHSRLHRSRETSRRHRATTDAVVGRCRSDAGVNQCGAHRRGQPGLCGLRLPQSGPADTSRVCEIDCGRRSHLARKPPG
jgi:hypothetical protein